MKPLDWPRYMLAKRLRGGEFGYYWSPHRRDLAAGCPLRREALGSDYAGAIKRAAFLNVHLDAWRRGTNCSEDRRYGTVSWLIETYLRSPAFGRVSERSRPEYQRALARIEDVPTISGGRVGNLPASSISPLAVDKIYAKLQQGPRGPRVRQANISLDIARRAWAVVRRTHPSSVPLENPWRGSFGFRADQQSWQRLGARPTHLPEHCATSVSRISGLRLSSCSSVLKTFSAAASAGPTIAHQTDHPISGFATIRRRSRSGCLLKTIEAFFSRSWKRTSSNFHASACPSF